MNTKINIIDHKDIESCNTSFNMSDKTIKLPERLSRTTIYESDYVSLYTDRVKLPSGQIIEKYHQIHYPSDVLELLDKNKDTLEQKIIEYCRILGK